MEEPFYLVPTFWVAVSFFVFVGMAAKPLGKAFANMLDTRSAQIASELEQAKRLREEAQAVYEHYRTKQAESLKEAEAMLARAKEDAAQMATHAEAELKSMLDKRMKLANERIAQSETKALENVQNHVVDIAIAAARSLISEHLERGGSKELTLQAAAELERKLH